MIRRSDLKDFEIDFERMFKIYFIAYPELEVDFISIINILSLLLNNFTMVDEDIDILCERFNVVISSLSDIMMKYDHLKLYNDIIKCLKTINKEYEKTEVYEICFNITKFISRYEGGKF